MELELDTVNIDCPTVRVKWTIPKFKAYNREVQVTNEWPFYSSDLSLPRSSHAYYLKVTDNHDYFKDDEDVSDLIKLSAAKGGRNESYNSSDEDIRELQTRAGWTLGGLSSHVVLTLCRRTTGPFDLNPRTKLKVKCMMYVENNVPGSVEHFVQLLPNGDTLLAALKLNYTQFENADLFVDMTIECEPNPVDEVKDFTGTFRRDLLSYMEKITASPTDVTLVASDGKIGTHRVLLSIRSEVFRAMFDSDMEERGKSTVDMVDLKKEVLVEFIRFLKSDQVQEMEKFASELFVLADKYRVMKLKKMCEQFLAQNVTTANSARLLALTQQIPSNVIESRLYNIYRINSQ